MSDETRKSDPSKGTHLGDLCGPCRAHLEEGFSTGVPTELCFACSELIKGQMTNIGALDFLAPMPGRAN